VGARAVYELYGLRVESDFPLPARTTSRSLADVSLELASSSRFAEAHRLEKGRERRNWFSARTLKDGSTHLCWTDLFEFLVDASGQRVLCCPLRGATQESLTTYLLGQVLSHSLLAFGVEPLHGSAVCIGRQAVGILGGCGRGKSTLAASLLARGCPIVTDDLMALEPRGERWRLHPGIPRIKLFPSAARRILGGSRSGRPMNPGTSKLVLPLDPAQVARRPLPLRVLYVLAEPATRSIGDRVEIEPLGGRAAFIELIRASFNLVAVDRGRLANQFALATRISSAIPVRRLTYRRSYRNLGDVCDAIASDVRGS
jgi:hypothetical protein